MQHNNTFVVIMAGGVGSRFWPGSREACPKQFIDMLGVGKSLLRLTFERFTPLCPPGHIFVVTNKIYAGLVHEHLPELPKENILSEPTRNNTAPAIAYSAFKLAAIDPDATLVVAPADHIVLRPDIFHDKLRLSLEFASTHDALITLGIQPNRPDTGYGYIQFAEEVQPGIRRVQRFTEKPNQQTALQFLDSGEYLWNAGIFVWSIRAILSAYKGLAPEIHHLFEQGEKDYNTPREQAFIDAHYPHTPNISVDFAILEAAPNVYTVPADFGWSDLGTWASLHAECAKDADGNVLQGDQIMALDLENCLVRMPAGKLAVLKDLKDYILVDTGDVLLAYPKSKEQEIKQVTALVRERFGERFL